MFVSLLQAMDLTNKAWYLILVVTERNSNSISDDITDDWYVILVVTERNSNSISDDITDDWYLILVE